MTVLKSNISTRSDGFKANKAALEVLIADLRAKVDQVKAGGGEAARAKHLARRIGNL